MSKLNRFYGGKQCVIAGATSALGTEIAIELAQVGASLLLIGRNEDKLAKLSERCKSYGNCVEYYVVDLASPKEVESFSHQTIAEIQNPFLLIYCAAENIYGRLTDIPEAVAKQALQVNVFSQITLITAILPAMTAANIGNISMLTSGTAVFSPPYESYYSGSKAMLERISEGLRLELHGTGVNISLISPSAMPSPTLLQPKMYGNPPKRSIRTNTKSANSNAIKILKKISNRQKFINLSWTRTGLQLSTVFFKSLLLHMLRHKS